MHTPEPLKSIEGMDIYLIDQVMKGRYQKGESILDAGAGGGRNLNWFFREGFNVTACDLVSEREELIKSRYPEAEFEWATCDLSSLPFKDASFDHVICNAVLHFASGKEHFEAMFSELVRVTKKGGTLFIRTCGIMGIEDNVEALGDGRFIQQDGETRYLLDKNQVDLLLKKQGLQFLEAFKYVNVEGHRVMCTLVLVKRS